MDGTGSGSRVSNLFLNGTDTMFERHRQAAIIDQPDPQEGFNAVDDWHVL